VKTDLARWLATWFGCGYCPVAPGTAGSTAALAIAWGWSGAFGWSQWHWLAAAAAIVPVGVWASGVVARDTGRGDPAIVVIDEVAGQWLTLAAVPALDWKGALAAFLLFRLFDIWKPPPIRSLERLGGGFGIMADDLAAGLYAATVLLAVGGWLW